MGGEQGQPAGPAVLVIESGYLELGAETRCRREAPELRLQVGPGEGILSVWELVVEERCGVPTEYYLG